MTEVTELPARIQRLPVNKAGYRVPWFADQTGPDEWDFRVVRKDGIALAHNNKLCWVCGDVMGAYKAFVIGPMCVINRVSSEPPSHRDCALFSVQACPFLTRPNMRRRTTGIDDDTFWAPGIMVERNPGASAVWTTKKYRAERVPAAHGKGVLFDIGDPVRVEWFAEGRPATRVEVEKSIEEGYPLLLEAAEKDGPSGLAHLAKATEAARKLLPAAVTP